MGFVLVPEAVWIVGFLIGYKWSVDDRGLLRFVWYLFSPTSDVLWCPGPLDSYRGVSLLLLIVNEAEVNTQSTCRCGLLILFTY